MKSCTRLGLTIALVSACGSGAASLETRPVASLSESTDAMRAMVEIREAWMTPPPAWAALRLKLARFVERYPKDALASVARLYMANVDIELGDLASAMSTLDQVKDLPAAGTLTDLDTVTAARLQRARHQPEAALDALRPLVGKAVDPIVRELLLAEVTLAAVDARRDYEAIAYMDAWLRDTSEDHLDTVLSRIDETLASMPPSAIEGSLRAMQANPENAYATPLRKKMAQRLARYAADTNNAQLAKWLLDPQSGTAMIDGEDARALKDLATTLRGRRSVAGRSIGLVLPTNTAELRDAAADVARGVAFALDLPKKQGAIDDGTRLLTRSEGGGDTPEAAFEELVGEGASIIIAGLDDAGTARALAWSEQNGVPMVLLGDPASPPFKFSFVVGDSVQHTLDPLVAALVQRKRTKAAVLAGTMEQTALAAFANSPLTLLPPTSCDPPLSRARFPTTSWEKDHIDVVLVSGSDACARAVMPALKSGTILALGPRPAAGVSSSTRDVKVLAVAAGAFPLGAPGARGDARMAEYRDATGHPPTWWTALGYDAATLTRKAVGALPLDETTNVTELTRRRELARTGLASAHAPLWTTDATGFAANKRVLERTLRVVELPIATTHD